MHMKSNLFLLLVGILLFSSCNKDDDTSLEDTLHYDGANQSAPNLDADTYEAAARFDASRTAEYTGRNLDRVSFFVGELPTQCIVKVYGEGTNSQPGNLLYSADVTDKLTGLDWNNHRLTDPIEITGEDLWISIQFTHTGTLRSIGCDEGPAATDGDWLYQLSDNQWLTLRDRLPININWNIRGHIKD